ncbi:hypothetical protein ACWIUD_09485 [Helicobacter sp. 23-1044]
MDNESNSNDLSLQGESIDSRPTSSLRGSGEATTKQSKQNCHIERSEISQKTEILRSLRSLRMTKKSQNLKFSPSQMRAGD